MYDLSQSIYPGSAQGTVLAMSPFESHHDPRLFGPDAASFDPLRPDMRLSAAAAAGGDKGERRNGGGDIAGLTGLGALSFGGGRYRYAKHVGLSITVGWGKGVPSSGRLRVL